jgi:pyridoxamine 5'-phosphate oxidase
VDERGFTFYTNYGSAKAACLAANPRAAVTFLWLDLERQVHVQGSVERVSAAESDAYFAVRPYGSQIGALASPQSEVIVDRAALEERFQRLREQYPEGSVVPRPVNWGGYRLVPEKMEFWQGRRSRLHDRLRYTRVEQGWEIDRLCP